MTEQMKLIRVNPKELKQGDIQKLKELGCEKVKETSKGDFILACPANKKLPFRSA